MAQFLLSLTWHRIQLQIVDRNCFWSAMQFQAFACSLHDSCITPCYRVSGGETTSGAKYVYISPVAC